MVTGPLCRIERERGWTPILSGRDEDKLKALGGLAPGLDRRPANIDDAGSLDRALAHAAAVINCAGPFAATSAPLIEAALRARIPYLDVAAEVEANVDTFEHYAACAREVGIAVVPAMAFYGGLGDLLATAASGLADRRYDLHRVRAQQLETDSGDEGHEPDVEAAEGRPSGCLLE
jgi:short subunit dehydrogenase-like uncharacterized protein